MSDQTTAETPKDEGAPAPLVSHFNPVSHLTGGAVKEVAQLAQGVAIVQTMMVKTPDDVLVPLAFVKEGEKYAPINLATEADKWRTAPRRRRGTATADTLESFIDLVNRHSDKDSAVFASIADHMSPSLTAVIDYHRQETEPDAADHAPRFGKHRVAYAFPLSDEWKDWIKASQSSMERPWSQLDFAFWLENHKHDLSSPVDTEVQEFKREFGMTFATPAEMITLARGLQVHVESKVGSVVNTQNGEGKILFEEVHKDADGKELKVPGLFVVNIPLFVGGAPQRLITRLFYRKSGTGVSWCFQFYRWRDTFRAALLEDLRTVREETSLPVYEGKPEVE